MKVIIRLFSLGIILLLTNCFASAETFSTANKTYTVTTQISNQTISLGQNTTLVFKGGKMRNCTITGNNTKVIVSNQNAVFENCHFKGVFVDSRLYATNFGCVSDMKVYNSDWKFKKSKSLKVKSFTGTNNKNSLNGIGEFCSNSKRVSILFNGKFYTPIADNTKTRAEGTSNRIVIQNASFLSLSGGTLLQGIYLYSCNNIKVQGMNFVGQHEVHDFPPIYYAKANLQSASSSYEKLKKQGFTIDNCGNITDDQYAAFGLSPNALVFVSEPGKTSETFEVDSCHFEMRMSGIVTTFKGNNVVKNVKISNCTFSHIYFQPLGLSAVSGLTATSVKSDYCLQGFDINAGSDNVTIFNSSFTNCFMGAKQEASSTNRLSSNNKMINCYYQINQKYRIVDLQSYIFLAAQAKNEDYFEISNSNFDVQTDQNISGFLCRAYGMKIKGCTVNVKCTSNLGQEYNFGQLFSTQGKPKPGTYTTPHFIVENSVFNLNGSPAYIAGQTGCAFKLTMNNVKVNGSKPCTHAAISGLSSVELNNCSFNTPFTRNVIEYTPEAVVRNSSITEAKRMFFNTAKDADCRLTITGSSINVGGALCNVTNAKGLNLNVSNNSIRCGSMLNVSDNALRSVTMNVQSNAVENTGTTVFSGLERISGIISTRNSSIKSNTISSTRSASLSDGNSRQTKAIFSGNRTSSNVR